jgi:cytoskeletal protein RodZ
MSKRDDSAQYPPDEFDDSSSQGPVGLHRGSRTVISRLLPYIITLVVVVIVALAVWLWVSGTAADLFSNDSKIASPSSTSQSSSSSQGSDSPSTGANKGDDGSANSPDNSGDNAQDPSSDGTSDQNQGTDTQTPTTPATPPIDYSTQVIVYNATSKNGYAAGKVAILKQAGYTTVSAGNKNAGLPNVNTVYYKDDSSKAAAQDIAQKLGITALTSLPTCSAPVVVVLVQ